MRVLFWAQKLLVTKTGILRNTFMEKSAAATFSKIQAGDAVLFEQAYSQYFSPIYKYLYFRVHDTNIANDLVQTVFLKLFQRIGTVQSHDQCIKTLYVIARTTLIDYWRASKHRQHENFNDYQEGTFSNRAGSEEEQMQNDTIQLVKKLLTNLSEDDAEIVTMKYMGGLSSEEIAAIIGKTPEAVRQIQSRAIKKMRQILETHPNFL